MQSKRNQKLISLIKKQFLKRLQHHAYLFSGPSGIGKSALVTEFGYFLHCTSDKKPCFTCNSCKKIKAGTHPYVLNIYPELSGKSATSAISIKKIQELNHFLSLTIPAGFLRVIGIHDAQYLTVEAQNALLKLLEEPSDRSVIFLTVDHPQNLLKTIVSRTQNLKFTPTPNLDILEYLTTLGIKDAEYLAISAAGKPQVLKNLLKNPDESLSNIKKQLELVCKIADVPLYKRIKLSEKLSGNPGSIYNFLKLFKNYLYYQLKKEIDNKSGDKIHSQNFIKKINLIKESEIALEKGINPKLVLENFFLNL